MRFPVAAIAAVVMLLVSVGVASAHEHRQVGDYQFIVGFLNEPAIVEEPNGLDLRVHKGQEDQGTPVEGLDKTLKAEVTSGGQTMPLELKAAFGQPGNYKGNFIPTAEGDYTFHITGTINGQPVDQKFTSSPTTFSSVGSRTALTFPVKVPPVAQVAETAANASSAADSAKLFGIAGLGVGVLGLIAGIAGIMMARGARASGDTSTARLTSHQTGD
jgi:hypothetical protein